MLEEEGLAVQGVDGDVFSAACEKEEGGASVRMTAFGRSERGRTDHLTRVIGSFLGHICSNVSVLIFHWERMLARMDRWTEDLTLTWPETSAEGWNLT